MSVILPPIPPSPIGETHVWRDWFTKLQTLFATGSTLLWTNLNFTGSNLRDIQTKQHNSLDNIQGGSAAEAYHLTLAQSGYIQDPSAVSITGGSISGVSLSSSSATLTGGSVDGITIGNSTPSTGVFTTVTGNISVTNSTATTATTGASGAIPAQVAGYLILNISGTNYKLPYYNT